MDATVLIKPPGIGTWGVIGRDYGPGIMPQGLSCTANEWGPDTCSFTLRRDSTLPWGDVLPYAEIEVEQPGSGVVWGGRVWDTQNPSSDELSVVCRGWQYALDDDVMRRAWVEQGLSGWVDMRTVPSVNYAVFPRQSDFQTQTGGTITLSVPARALTAGNTAAVILDMSQADARSVSVDYVNLTNPNASIDFLVQQYDDTNLAGGVNLSVTATTTMTSPGTDTITVDGASAKRVLLLGLQARVGVTPLNPVSIQITNVRVFRDPTYRTGAASALTAGTVIRDVRTAVLSTVLSTDESLIGTTTTAIPHMSTWDMGSNGYATPRQVMTACNAFHDWILKVDADKRLRFQARPTTPDIEVGEWSGVDFTDQGDTGEDLYNRVLVQYTDPGGAAAVAEVTATSPLLTLGGITRTKILAVSAPMTSTAATELGTVWLNARTRRPTRGSVTVRGDNGARYIVSSARVHPADFLAMTGQMIRLSHRWNPDDGGWGRDGYITNVSWSAESNTATVALDSPRDRIDTFLNRYGANLRQVSLA